MDIIGVMNDSNGNMIGFDPKGPNAGNNDVNQYVPTATNQMNFDEDNWLSELQKQANQGNEAALQMLMNYYMTRQSEQSARDYNAQREDTYYQRMIADMKKAGISPYALSAGSAPLVGASGHSFTGSQYVSKANNERTTSTSSENVEAQNFIKIIGTIIGLIGAMAIAAA